MKKNYKKIYLAIAVICLLIAVAAGAYLVKYFLDLQKGERENEALREQIEIAEESSEEVQPTETSAASEETVNTSEETASSAEGETEEALLRKIDFADMQANTNEDIYSWIYIPDTNIDYPVLQHPTDDTYYLNYNMDGTKGYPGCIYTEKANAKDYTDFNTVLYGHNMKNGSMFHDLHKYADASFMEEHPCVYVYLPDQTLKYQIFAAYRYDDRHLLYSFDYNSEKVREGYLQDIFNLRDLSAVLDDAVEVTAEDTIITLSTCIGGQDNRRFLVQAVLLEEGINE